MLELSNSGGLVISGCCQLQVFTNFGPIRLFLECQRFGRRCCGSVGMLWRRSLRDWAVERAAVVGGKRRETAGG